MRHPSFSHPLLFDERTVLLVVDVQNDFCDGGALVVPGGSQVVPVINRIRTAFSRVVLTQDWHPPDHSSFAANHPGKRVGEVIPLGGIEQILWPVHCVQESQGAELHPDLVRTPDDAVFRKGTDREIDSYSAFFDNGHRKSTGLGEALRRDGVERVFLCGLATDYCVKYSALDALREGFDVAVVTDACRAVNLKPGDGEAALAELGARGITLTDSRSLHNSGSTPMVPKERENMAFYASDKESSK